MKKILTLCALLLLPFIPVLGGNLSVDEAKSLAQAFLRSQAGDRHASSVTVKQLALETQLSGCYVFNNAAGPGYVIIASDDDAPQPVLAFSDEGSLCATDLPCNLRWMLSEYAAELAWAREHSALNASSTSSTKAAHAPIVSKANISPLVQSHWNQSAPYNDLCPTVGSAATYTGCVATATAQIMRYHKHPATGTGSHSYAWNNQTLSCDFSQSTYDWDNMLLDYGSDYSTTQSTAVARLMADVGYAVSMDYGTSASGAYSKDVATALPTYFGYSANIKMLSRSSYGLTDWMTLLYQELAAGRPVYYAGSSTSGGHAFVVDGYRDGYFHVNWGWGGLSDGYFLISALDPDEQGIGGSTAGYNSAQEAILGIAPASADEETAVTVPDITMETFTATSATVSRTDAFSFSKQDSYLWNKSDKAATILVGLKVTGEDGSVCYLPSSSEVTIQAGYGSRRSAMNVPLSAFPSDASQTYTVTPAFRNAGDGRWYDIRIVTLGVNTCLKATTDADNVYFTTPAAGKPVLTVGDIELPEKIFAGKTFTLKTTVSATGGEYNNKIYAYAGSTQIGEANVNVDEQNSAPTAITCTAPSSTGSYTLTVKDKAGAELASGLSITADAVPTSTLALSVAGVDFTSTLPEKLQFTTTFQCSGGYYDDKILAQVYTNGTRYGQLTGQLRTWEGNTATVDFDGTFAGTTGSSYEVCFFYVSSTSGNTTSYSQLSYGHTFKSAASTTTAFDNIGALIDGAYAQYKAEGKTVGEKDHPKLSNIQVSFDATSNPATVVAVLQNDVNNDVEAGYVFVVDASKRGLMLMPSSNKNQVYDLSTLKVGDKITGQLAGNYSEKKGIPALEVRAKAGSYTSGIDINRDGEATETEEATYPVTQIPNINFLAKTNVTDLEGNTNVGDVTKQAYGPYLNSIITVEGTIREKNGEYYLLQNETDAVDDADLTRIYFSASELPDLNLADYVGTTGRFEGLLVKRNISESQLCALKPAFFQITKIYISEQDNEMRITDLVTNGALSSSPDIYLHRTRLVASADGYGTICLPFALTASEFKSAFGCEISLLAQATTEVSSDGVQKFASVQDKSIAAGVPYLLKATGTQTLGNGSSESDANYWTHIGQKPISVATPVAVTASYSGNIVNGDFLFCGTYGKKQYTTGSDGRPTTTLIADGGSQKYQYISTTDGTLRYLPATSTLAFNGLRAYYYFPSWNADANNAAQPGGTKSLVRIAVDNDATAIGVIEADRGALQPVYTLGGQRVANTPATLPKGVYVQGGRKFVVK